MERFVPIVRDQRAALLGVLAKVSAGDWQRPTVCSGWSVKDVASHLVEGELLFGAVYRGELRDLASDTQAGVDRWTKVDGDTVRYSLWHHGQATQRVIDSRSGESWRRKIDHSEIAQELELRHALRLHFVELAVHGWDVTSSLGVPGVWDDRAAPLAEYCLRSAPGALTRNGVAPLGTIEVRVAEVGTRTLGGDSGGWKLEAGPAADPAATWETDVETLVLTTTSRLGAADALARSRVEGDASMLEAVLKAWMVTS